MSGPWQQVKCADCGREYQCTPADDHYLPADKEGDDNRVCFRCLLAQVGLEPA